MIAIHWQNIDGMLNFKQIEYISDNKTLQEIIENFESWAISNINLDIKSAIKFEKINYIMDLKMIYMKKYSL